MRTIKEILSAQNISMAALVKAASLNADAMLHPDIDAGSRSVAAALTDDPIELDALREAIYNRAKSH